MVAAVGVVDAVTTRREISQATISSFLDDGGTVCHQAPLRLAEGALAMRKAAPRGSLYNASKVQADAECADRGYALAAGEDRCFPGLRVFFKDGAGKRELPKLEAKSLDVYAKRYGLAKDEVSLMSACTCHPKSEERAGADGRCEELQSVRGSWVHTNPQSGKELICDEGPYEYTARLLATLKASPLLPMHQHDQIAPVTCLSRGFKNEYMAIDHCYPQVRMWTHMVQPDPKCPKGGWGKSNPDCDDWGVVASGNIEKAMVMEHGFQAFANRYGLSPVVLNHFAGCNCRSDSQVIPMVKKRYGADICEGQEKHSPVRDFWEG